MVDARFLLKVSRPRFWIYVFGPFIVGLAGAASSRSEVFRPEIAICAIYFLFPASLLVYGVNDIYDYDTDRLNPKKNDYEQLVGEKHHRTLIAAILLTNVPLVTWALVLSPRLIPSLFGFWFFSIFYSAPPIRAKSKPVFDSLFNVLYVFPGIIGYQLVRGSWPPATVISAAALWTMAMHAYSAVPDIEADRASNLPTIATCLGARNTLVFCLLVYVASSILVFDYLGVFSVILGVVYALMIAASLARIDKQRIFQIYRLFPLVNTACGFVLFWYAVYYNWL